MWKSSGRKSDFRFKACWLWYNCFLREEKEPKSHPRDVAGRLFLGKLSCGFLTGWHKDTFFRSFKSWITEIYWTILQQNLWLKTSLQWAVLDRWSFWMFGLKLNRVSLTIISKIGIHLVSGTDFQVWIIFRVGWKAGENAQYFSRTLCPFKFPYFLKQTGTYVDSIFTNIKLQHVSFFFSITEIKVAINFLSFCTLFHLGIGIVLF